ncbi:MAG TPA: SHOCT domain-containing protein [Trebonia sp.]
MPLMRRRPLLRAAAVGGGAYLAGKRTAQRQAGQQYQDAAQDQRIGDMEQQQATVPAPRDSGEQPAAPSMADQLNQLADLHKQGVLSDDEFAAAKAKLLGT